MSVPANVARSRVPRIADAAVERARLRVVPRAVVRAARVPFVALVSLVLVGGVAGLLWFNTAMQQRSFLVTSMQHRADAMRAQRQSLQMQLDRMSAPQRVAVRARELGMVPPAGPAFLRLSDGRILGDPTPATTADAFRIRPLPTRKPKLLRPTPVKAKPPVTGAPAKPGHGGARTKKPTTDHATKKSTR